MNRRRASTLSFRSFPSFHAAAAGMVDKAAAAGVEEIGIVTPPPPPPQDVWGTFLNERPFY